MIDFYTMPVYTNEYANLILQHEKKEKAIKKRSQRNIRFTKYGNKRLSRGR